MIRDPGKGVRVTWDSLPGKPASFAPAAHSHAWGEVTGKPVTFPPASHTHPWSDITGAPATYPPAAHTHAWADITGKPTTFTPSAHTHLWADITDKPATFPPSTHTHSYSDLTDKPTIPPATGRLVLVGNVTVNETTLLALALGMKRMTLPLAGITTADMGKLLVVPNGAATTGCEVQNAYPASAGNVSIGYFTPALGLAATYSIPVSVYRIT